MRFVTTFRGAMTAAWLVVLSACSLAVPDAAVVVQESMQNVSVGETNGETDDDSPIPRPDQDPDGRQATVDPPVSSSTTLPDAEPPADRDVAEILEELQAQGFCDPADVEDEGVVTAMHFVVGGEIQAPCYLDDPFEGDDIDPIVVDDDPRLLDAWTLLTTVTPLELVDDISLFAGYEGCASCDTLAFVTQLDEGATFFVVAIDVVAAVDDPDELRLTMMHELTHVFAQAPGEQLVVADGPGGCATYFNGVGCFTDDSYMWAWIQEFWPPDLLATLPRDGSVGDENEAFERCATDAGYTGSYAAIHPEEDFAETFSAYVFDVDVDEAVRPKMEFFDRYPEFVAIRENARAAGFSGTEADFLGCGS